MDITRHVHGDECRTKPGAAFVFSQETCLWALHSQEAYPCWTYLNVYRHLSEREARKVCLLMGPEAQSSRFELMRETEMNFPTIVRRHAKDNCAASLHETFR